MKLESSRERESGGVGEESLEEMASSGKLGDGEVLALTICVGSTLIGWLAAVSACCCILHYVALYHNT